MAVLTDDDLSLVRLTADLGNEYLAMVNEFEAAGEGYPYNNISLARRDFPAFVRELEDEERGVEFEGRHFQQTTYVLIRDGGTVVGEIRFRPQTVPPFGGGRDHVGYNVRPSQRRRGYASYMLGCVLEQARALGLPGISLTVEGDNPASVRTIEKHGGALMERRVDEDTGSVVSVYWIGLQGE